MRPIAWTIVISYALLLGCARGEKPQEAEMTANERVQADLRAIQELRARDTAASKAFDVATLETLWSDDIVMLAPGAEPVIGREANRASLRTMAEQSRGLEVVDYNQEWRETTVAGDFAFEWGLITGAMRPKAGGQATRYRFKVMRVLRREPDGNWKVHRTMWNDAPLGK